MKVPRNCRARNTEYFIRHERDDDGFEMEVVGEEMFKSCHDSGFGFELLMDALKICNHACDDGNWDIPYSTY